MLRQLWYAVPLHRGARLPSAQGVGDMRGAWVGVALLAAVSLLGNSGAPQAQSANSRCPRLGELPADISDERLRCLCFQACGGQGPANLATPQAALNCGSIRALAAQASPSLPEGYVAQQQALVHCPPGVPDDHVPTAASESPVLEGRFLVSRGYSSPNPGVNPGTCQREYVEEAHIPGGIITFTGGGHTWTGTITDNGWINVSRDGIWPRPRWYGTACWCTASRRNSGH